MTILGWLLGVFLGSVTGIAVLTAFALPVPALLASFPAPIVLPASIPGVVIGLVLLAVLYVLAYVLATVSLGAVLPPFTPPLAAAILPGGGAAVAVTPVAGELFARGVMIGMTAALNVVGLALVPGWGTTVAGWAFIVISLAAVPAIALNLVYQGFLGWSAWLFPVSWIASGVGLLLFLVNAPVAFAAGGIGAFRIDFTTGVIETFGGVTGITGFGGGFSLGNFTFITATAAPTVFTVPGLSSHETGHSLNTAALGGVVLWINAVDENVAPFRKMNLAYGELTAESHAQALPPPPASVDFFVTLWG